MKAEIKPRIDLKNRTKLETVIPLRTPFIVWIEPTDKCNFQCKFCPTGDHTLMRQTPRRGHGSMDFEMYKKIINNLSEFEEKIKVVRLYKDGEPLLNPHFADMIKYAKDSGYCERVDTTTNASLLTHELSLAIVDAGLNRINISVEGVNNKTYADFSHYKIDFEKYVENIAFLYEHRKQCEMIVKINGDILSKEEKEQFYKTFGDIADGVFIESIFNNWPTFDMQAVEQNTNRGIYGQPIKEVLVCPYVFYSLFINSDGTYSICSVDWSRNSLPKMDALQSTPKEFWNSKTWLDLQKMFLRKERKSHPFCKDCGMMAYSMPDDIDEYAEELLKKIEEKA
jgi:MoaA/NifB/PqqE/SkfB family radical SAM enzyme